MKINSGRQKIGFAFLWISMMFVLSNTSSTLCKAQQMTQTPENKIRVIAILGDSITAGYGVKLKEALPYKLQEELNKEGYRVKILNAGVSGDTTAGGLSRVDWVLGDKPDGVLVALGGNDGLRGLNPKGTQQNLKAIIEKLKKAHVAVALAGMYAPPNLGVDYGRAFNGLYKTLASQENIPLYPFILQGVAGHPTLGQSDGIHPNPKGVTVIVKNLVPFIIKAFNLHSSS